MTVREALDVLKRSLNEIYDTGEASNIAQLVIEHLTGFNRSKIISDSSNVVSPEQQVLLDQILAELLTHKPVQYVLGEAWFMGMRFVVDENVLIPRPETEELVDLVKQTINAGKNTDIDINKLNLLDIGTGSGCIPIALKKFVPSVHISSIDISERALNIAKRNAERHNVSIQFLAIDFLDEKQWSLLPSFDVIVSNPPYIPLSDKSSMSDNVLKFEPHIALFVPEGDPLIFYKKALKLALSKSQACSLFFEIHEGAASLIMREFAHLQVELRKDLQGKDRFCVINV